MTTATATARPRQHDILEAARQVFAEHGFAHASVDEIAQRAGIAKGTVYLYYRSKETLCEAALLDRLDDLMIALASAVGETKGASARLAAFFATKLERFAANRDFLRMYLAEFGPVHERPGLPCQAVERARSGQRRLLERVLREGVASGEFRPLPVASTARLLLHFSRAAVEELLASESRSSPHRCAEAAVDLLLRGLAS